MTFSRFAYISFVMLSGISQGIASPDSFGSSQDECEDYSTDKYKSDLEYIQQELFNNTTLINAAEDVHQIEMRACKGMLYWG